VVNEQIETPDFKNMDIGKLRQYASHMRLPLAKTATKVEIIEAIERKLSGRVIPEFADGDTALKPGYSRITVLSDPMPQASNLPVFLNCNGYMCLIPRDKEVVVPNRVVRTLRDAKVKRRKQTLQSDSNGREVFRETEVISPSYPFTIHETKEGPEVYTALEIARQRTAGPKRRYKQIFGRYPRPRELTRAIEQGLIKVNDDEQLEGSTEAILEESKADA
jgi:hypothetical protein